MSQSLVSSVLQGGSSNVGYSPDTRRRVLLAARELNYRKRKTNGVGVIHSIGSHQLGTMDWVRWVSPMLTSIHQEALGSNKLVSVFGYSAAELDTMMTGAKWPQIFKRKNIDGLVLSGNLDKGLLDHLGEIEIPHVLMNVSDSYTHAEDSVCFDELFTGTQATQYLIEKGHKRILHLSVNWSDNHYSVSGRRRGYDLAMADAGLESRIIEHEEDRHLGYPSKGYLSQLTEILTGTDAPTAIFAYDEVVAMCCYQVIYELGLKDEICLMPVAWRDIRLMRLLRIPSVELPAMEMGRMAFRMLLEKLTTNLAIPTLALRGRIRDRDGSNGQNGD
jgi:DNA-binding LacI/PurR family transcriptional regulator